MYDEKVIAEALELVASGMSYYAVSKRFGGRPCPNSVKAWVKGALPARRKRQPRGRFETQVKKEAVQRVLDGDAYRTVAKGVGCADTTLLNWRKAYLEHGEAGLVTEKDAKEKVRRLSAEDLPDDPEELKAMVLELKFQADLAREMLEIVKKDPGADPENLSRKEMTLLVRRLLPEHSLTFLIGRLNLPESTYHYQKTRIDEAKDPDADIRDAVVRVFSESGQTYGYRRIKATLAADGIRVSEKRVRRVMAQEGLAVLYDGKRRRRYDSYDRAADEADREAVPNVPLLENGKHDFSAPAPNVLWVTDVTEFSLPDTKKKVYLSAILDCFDSSIVGFEAATTCTSKGLTDPSLRMACEKLRKGDSPVLHSDRGVQYHAESWKVLCKDNGIRRSLSRKATSPDNARMEGCFGTMKNERYYWRDWSGWTAGDFIIEVGRWVTEYNETRRKLSLGWKTPMEYRKAALEAA